MILTLPCGYWGGKRSKTFMKLSIHSYILQFHLHFFPTNNGKFPAIINPFSEGHLGDFASTSFKHFPISLLKWCDLGEGNILFELDSVFMAMLLLLIKILQQKLLGKRIFSGDNLNESWRSITTLTSHFKESAL